MNLFEHTPVMMAEVLTALRPRDGGRYADGTAGGAGHMAALLRSSAPTGWVYGCDRDGDAIEAASVRLAEFAGRFELRRCNFDTLAEWVPATSLDGVLLDLGASSPQFDWAHRGFSLNKSGPLDMRQDARQPLTAAEILETWGEAELAKMFWVYGDEKFSRRYARAIVERRGMLRTTLDLAALIEAVTPGGMRGATHPATRVFQALRMAVNDELGSLERGLLAAWGCVKPGGRLVVITFHSGEDRMVKHFGRERERDYALPEGLTVDVPELRQPRAATLRWAPRKPIQPSEQEMKSNPRSRSAQLRVMEKLS